MTDDVSIVVPSPEVANGGVAQPTEPLWMRDESFPTAPSERSYGMLGFWRRRLSFEGLSRRVRRGMLSVSSLTWTPEGKHVLPVWEHPSLRASAWSASQRFWIGLSTVAFLFAGYDFYDLLQPGDGQSDSFSEVLIGKLIDVTSSTTVLFFCLWQ